MAQQVQMWRDQRGFLHENAEAADNADQAFELGNRRQIVAKLLVAQIQSSYGPARSNPTGGSSAQLANWMIDNWQALGAIGFAYRVHELGSVGELSIFSPASSAAE